MHAFPSRRCSLVQDRRGLQQAGHTPGCTPFPFPRWHVLGTGSPDSLGGCINDLSSLGFIALLVSCHIAPFVPGPPDIPPPFLLPVCAAPAPHSLPCEALHFPAPIPVMFKPLVFNTTKCNTDSVKSIKQIHSSMSYYKANAK